MNNIWTVTKTYHIGHSHRPPWKLMKICDVKSGFRAISHENENIASSPKIKIVDMEKIGERHIKIDCDVIQADGGTRTASISGAFLALAIAIKKFKKYTSNLN